MARDPLRASPASCIDLERGDVLPARARLERLLEWVAPVADEIGAAPYLAIPERNAAERQIARFEEGATLEEIYAEQASASRSVADETRSASRTLVEALSQLQVSDLLVQTLSTVSSLAYHRLSERAPRPRAGAARDRRAARARPGARRLGPAELTRDFEQVTANLQLAYAAAVAAGLLNQGTRRRL